MSTYKSIEWREGVVRMLDQRLLPLQTQYIDYTDYQDVADGIRTMVIRGAPAIGAAAAYGIALAAFHSEAQQLAPARSEISEAAEILKRSRPTAVNLFWAIDRMLTRLSQSDVSDVTSLQRVALTEAHLIAEQDIQTNKQIGQNALELVPENAQIIHHCNTGSLATVAYGTALGVIRTAHENGKNVHVYVDETRPRLQGARLTSWELKELGVPHTVIVDGASGHFMRKDGVDFCVVGCDRVAANGDTANKIGTYNLAVVAKAHDVPFYIAAPTSTIDMNIIHGDDIEIEERGAAEVTHVGSTQITPDDVRVANPAFDVTPAEFITAIITEFGIAYPPFTESLKAIMTSPT